MANTRNIHLNLFFAEIQKTVDQRVITGQNPGSAKSVGEAILQELKK